MMNHHAAQNAVVADNVIDLKAVCEAKQTQASAMQAAYDAECARRAHLDAFLSNLLLELEAA